MTTSLFSLVVVWLLQAVSAGESQPHGQKMSLMRAKSVEITAGAKPNDMRESLISTSSHDIANVSAVSASSELPWHPSIPAQGCIRKVASGWGRRDAADCAAPIEHWCSWLRRKSNCSSSSLCKWTSKNRCQASVKEPYTSGQLVDLWITAQPFCASIKEDRCEDAQELCQSGLVEAWSGFNYCVPKVLRSKSMLTDDEAWSFCSAQKEEKCHKSQRCHWGDHPTAEGWIGCQPITKSQYELIVQEIVKFKKKNLDLQKQVQMAKGDPGRSSDCDIMGVDRLPKGTGDGLHFRCKSGYCISYSDRCNGFKNCGDGSDEEGCDRGTWESAWNRWPLVANFIPQ